MGSQLQKAIANGWSTGLKRVVEDRHRGDLAMSNCDVCGLSRVIGADGRVSSSSCYYLLGRRQCFRKNEYYSSHKHAACPACQENQPNRRRIADSQCTLLTQSKCKFWRHGHGGGYLRGVPAERGRHHTGRADNRIQPHRLHCRDNPAAQAPTHSVHIVMMRA